MQTERYRDALTFASDEPDVGALRMIYDSAVLGVEDYLDQTRIAYDDRHEIWPGKHPDGRKHGALAFPWEGASDLETRQVETKIRTYAALSADAMRRSHIQAYPVEVGDAARAKVVSSFLKWMTTSWIEGYDRFLDQSANYFFEKGLMVTYVGWDRKKVSRLQEFDLEELNEVIPQLAAILADPTNDDAVVSLLQEGGELLAQIPGMEGLEGAEIKPARARKALKQLRKDGKAYLPMSRLEVDRPLVRACRPDADVLFPSWTVDPQRAPYAFYRDYLTPQEILGHVESDGWDREWAEYVIEHFVGISTLELQEGNDHRRGSRLGRYESETSDLVEVLYMYQRLIDEDDGAEGIYCTVFHPELAPELGDDSGPTAYAKRDLLSDLGGFPFVVTDLCSDEPRMYEVTTFPDLMRSAQKSIKVERDGRIDGNSKRNLPERNHPAGRPPTNQGPGVLIPYRRRDEIYYSDVPAPNPDAVAMDVHLVEQIDMLLGLHPDDPDGPTKKAYYLQKFLSHQRDVLDFCYRLYNLYGPEEKFFRVTGLPENMQMLKQAGEELDIFVSFDTLMTDPENIETMLRQLFQIIPMDQGGRINMDQVITFAASAISPIFAANILQPSEEGATDLLRQFTEDWAKLWSGIEVDAPPNGAGVILPAMQGLQNQQDVVEALQSNEALATRVQNYYQQLEFQQQQLQNAETGRRGAKPADIPLNQAPFPTQKNGTQQRQPAAGTGRY